MSIYGRPLSSAEIQSIYMAGMAGKCVTAAPPFVLTQPSDQTALAGSSATFSFLATGTQPLSYQWSFDGTPLADATGSILVLTNVQPGNAGVYNVTISNPEGSTTSSNAVLTVTFPPALISVLDAQGPAGSAIRTRVIFSANGNENALSFSLSFNPSLLQFANISAGSGTGAAALLVNTNQVGSGRIGFALSLPVDTTFACGPQEIAQITFTSSVSANPTATPISFTDLPIPRQISDSQGLVLPGTYQTGNVSLATAELKGDVSPHPTGDRVVTVTDWVVMGRYVARLDYPANASELARADCAPRQTSGDGAITVSDWVQTGRYVAGFDPPTAVTTASLGASLTASASIAAKSSSRQLGIGSALLLGDHTCSLPVTLTAAGGENAVAFSVAFDAKALAYAGATLGRDATGGTLNVNGTQAGSGRLAFVLALSPGNSLAAGTRTLIKINFRAAATAESGTYGVSLIDQPVPREVSDVAATVMAAQYLNGLIALNDIPTLQIELSGQNVRLAWPLWASPLVVQQTAGPLNLSTLWTNLITEPVVTETEYVVTVPIPESISTFFRLAPP